MLKRLQRLFETGTNYPRRSIWKGGRGEDDYRTCYITICYICALSCIFITKSPPTSQGVRPLVDMFWSQSSKSIFNNDLGWISARIAEDATMTLYKISARMNRDAKMKQDHISAWTTYVMWREERLLNVGVLQRVRLSDPASQSVCHTSEGSDSGANFYQKKC
jgi:hypothetical protein